jgi:hypothetical protein
LTTSILKRNQVIIILLYLLIYIITGLTQFLCHSCVLVGTVMASLCLLVCPRYIIGSVLIHSLYQLYSGLRSQMCCCWTNDPWWRKVCVCVCVCIYIYIYIYIRLLSKSFSVLLYVFNSSIMFCMLPCSCLLFRMCIAKADFEFFFYVSLVLSESGS